MDARLGWGVLVALAWWGGAATAQNLEPAEALQRMQLPPGVHATAFATEPILRQPVAGTMDERGRIWVIEYLQYPNPAGLVAVSVDRYLRTEYDRVPEPPPRGPRGADRIKILEDTDGDGRADSCKTFVEGLNLASGLCVGHGGLFVGQAPYLLFYPDRDRDDRPDGDPEVLLSGFGMQDAHATINSLCWGPDGWLYGAQGSTVTARINGIEFQQGIWRYHPITREFELFAEGGGNTWGLDFDAVGEAFGSSNGNFVAFHMMQGGWYIKGFAKHGPLHNPRTYGYFECLAYDGPRRGGHVTPGGIIYQETMFPPEYRNTLWGGNLLSNAAYWHPLRRDGSTYRARHGGEMIVANDPNFRPIDLFPGPDGAVYVVDWYDRRASHLDPRDNWDRTNGRIYKLTYGDPQPPAAFDLSSLSSAQLVALQDEPAAWRANMARRLLAERRDPGVIDGLRAAISEEKDEVRAARKLWALAVSGGFHADEDFALACLDHPAAAVRKWAVRLVGDSGRCSVGFALRLARLAREESDPLVIAQLASSAARWSWESVEPTMAALLRREGAVTDRHVPMLVWWAIERHLRDRPDFVVKTVADAAAEGAAIARATVTERLGRALLASGTLEDDERFARLAARVPAEDQGRLIAGAGQALAGSGRNTESETLRGWRAKLVEEGSGSGRDVAARLGEPAALTDVVTTAGDPDRPEAARVAALELLGETRTEPGRVAVLRVLGRQAEAPAPPQVATAAVRSAARWPTDEMAEVLIKTYASFDPTTRKVVIDALCQHPGWSRRLFEAIGADRVPARDVGPAHVRQVLRIDEAGMRPLIEAHWGRVPAADAAATDRIAAVRGMLPEGDKGNAERGRAVFAKVCAGCHRLFGQGAEVGPDLTGADRGDLEFLLQSVVAPDALVRKEFQASVVEMTDGRVLTGLIVEESESALVLFGSDQRRQTLARDQVASVAGSPGSAMPAGLLDPLGEPEIRDLFRFLQGSGP